jgi:hypothetical protein
MIVDTNKTYENAAGNPVRIYSTDGGGAKPVHGATQGRSGEWHIGGWRADGTATLSTNQLTEVEMLPEYWVVFDKDRVVISVFYRCPKELPDGYISVHHPAQKRVKTDD